MNESAFSQIPFGLFCACLTIFAINRICNIFYCSLILTFAACTLLEPLVEPVPCLEMGRVASGRASVVKFLPQHTDFEYQWIFRMGKVAWCSDCLGQWRIKQVFVDVICLWPAGGNLGGIHATVWYLTIYPFQLRGKLPTQVILENHEFKFYSHGKWT
jgi:hypothetical protein